MIITIQVTPDSINFNGIRLEELLEKAAAKAVEMASKQKEDPLEMIALKEVAKMFGCSQRTMSRRAEGNNVKTYKQGKRVCVFRKDIDKLLKQY